MRVSYNFHKVTYTADRWVLVDGVRKKRQKTFMQTINPFNINADGKVKTRQEIMAELKQEAEAWQKAKWVEVAE